MPSWRDKAELAGAALRGVRADALACPNVTGKSIIAMMITTLPTGTGFTRAP